MCVNKGIRPFVAYLIMLQIICFSASFVPAAQDSQAPPEVINPSENARKYQLETEKGLFTLEISIQNDFTVGMNMFDLLVRDREGQNVKDARILIVPWMPEHAHSISENVSITEKSDGSYHVENVQLNMKGNWEIRIRIIQGGVTDKAVLKLSDVS
ncbi:MAG: FixH family protein [Nitrospiraceae bacterium]|nr:MAG: FixH family protein [Nitrospiraceae bacterium]